MWTRVATLGLAALALTGCGSQVTGQAAPAGPTGAAPSSTASAAALEPDVEAYRAEAFLSALRSQGLPVTTSEREVRRATTLCDMLRTGTGFPALVAGLQANGYSAHDAGAFLGTATAAYCFDQVDKLQS